MIFSEGNQRVYLFQKHKIMSFLKDINSKTKILIAYHGAASGEIATVLLLKFLHRKHNKKYTLYNFAELKEKEFKQIKTIVRKNKIDKIIFIEGFGLPECYKEFNEIAINIDSHNNEKEPITPFLNPVAAKFEPRLSTSLIMYDLLKDHVSVKYKWLVAISSIIDYNSLAARNIVSSEKNIMQKLEIVKPYFLACQYNQKWGDYLIKKIVDKPTLSLFQKDKELNKRVEDFNKKIKSCLKEIEKKYKSGPVYYEVYKQNYRLPSPLATTLSEIYKDKMIFIVEKIRNSQIVRISIRFRNDDTDLEKITKKIAKNFKDTDAIGHKDTASIRTVKKNVKKIYNLLSKYC